jgi:omega-amidase
MKVSCIQGSLFWEDALANRNYFEEKINSIQEEVDLIVLPEMFTSGFTMNPSVVAEEMSGETVLWLKNMAIRKNVAITGSMVISENTLFFNRMLFVFPNGEIRYYDKKHLFTLAGEDKSYTAGNEKVIISYLNWNICLQICYDLRFPVFVRNTEDYDAIIYVANWPKPRIAAWDALLKARAIENMCYVIGVNRIGEDGNGHPYVGHTQIIDELGNYLVAPDENESVFTATLSHQKMIETRNKLGFLNDRDVFQLR